MPQPPGQPPQQPQAMPAQGLGADILGELRHNVGGVLQQAQSPTMQMAGPISSALLGPLLLSGLARGLTVPLEQRDPGSQSLTPQHVRDRGNLQGDILASALSLLPGGAMGGMRGVEEVSSEVPGIVGPSYRSNMAQRLGIHTANDPVGPPPPRPAWTAPPQTDYERLAQAAREHIQRNHKLGLDPNSNLDLQSLAQAKSADLRSRIRTPANDPRDVQPYYKAAEALQRGDLREAFTHLPQQERIKHLDNLYDAVNKLIDTHSLAGDPQLVRDLSQSIEQAADAIEKGRPEGEFALRKMENVYNRYAKTNPALMEKIGEQWLEIMSKPEMVLQPRH